MTTFEQPGMGEVDYGLRYRCEDVLRKASRSAILYLGEWDNLDEFTAHVIRPALFPEHFTHLTEIGQSNVVEIADFFKIEPLDSYRTYLQWGMLELRQQARLTWDDQYEVESILGWTALATDATVIPFPVDRVKPAAAYADDHIAQVIYPFGA